MKQDCCNFPFGSRHTVGPPSPASNVFGSKDTGLFVGGPGGRGEGAGNPTHLFIPSSSSAPALGQNEKKKKSFLADPIWNLIVWTAAAALGCQPGWLPAWALDASPPGPQPAANPHQAPMWGWGNSHPVPPASNPSPSSHRLVPILWWQLLAGPQEAVILYITTNRSGPLTNRPA